MSILADAHLGSVRDTINKIDSAVLAVQDLASREPQEFPDRPRLKELRRIARTLAQCEAALQELYK